MKKIGFDIVRLGAGIVSVLISCGIGAVVFHFTDDLLLSLVLAVVVTRISKEIEAKSFPLDNSTT